MPGRFNILQTNDKLAVRTNLMVAEVTGRGATRKDSCYQREDYLSRHEPGVRQVFASKLTPTCPAELPSKDDDTKFSSCEVVVRKSERKHDGLPYFAIFVSPCCWVGLMVSLMSVAAGCHYLCGQTLCFTSVVV